MGKAAITVTKETTDLSSEVLSLYEEYSRAGMEEMDASDFAIPFIKVVQSLSPERQKNHPKYIEGAEEGTIFNTLTQETWDGAEGVRLIPVLYRKTWIEWIPRDAGGGDGSGFVSQYPTYEQALQNANSNNDVEETANFFALVEGSNGFTPAIISMTSTKLGLARKWNMMAENRKITMPNGRKFTPPFFGIVYRLGTFLDQRKLGSFYNYTIEDDGLTTELEDGLDVFQAARGFLTALQEGAAEINFNNRNGNSQKDVGVSPAEVLSKDTPF